MKLSLLKSLVASLLVFGGLSAAKAQLLTFDSLPGNQTPVPAGYGGLNWNNFDYLDSSTMIASGYVNGTVSPSRVAYNAFGTQASVTSASTFDLTSLYLTAAWNDGLSVTIDGYLSGSLLYTNTFVVNTSGPTFELLNYLGVDEVRFVSSGGVSHGFGGSGTHFVLDNVALNGAGVSAVPEPSTYGLFAAAGLIGVVALRRRIKR